MKKSVDYYLGIDGGTNTVGMAVTDTNYRLLRCNKKAMWSVHSFEEAQDAQERRAKRTSRRRNTRKKWRSRILEQFFCGEIEKIDATFFLRLKESWKHLDHKESNVKFSLFCDPDFTDIEYHEHYPTIFHLIRELATNDSPTDIRLVYLAIHYLVTHRGHFLSNVDVNNLQELLRFGAVFKDFCGYLESELCLDWSISDATSIQNALKSKKIGLKGKNAIVIEAVTRGLKPTAQEKALVGLLCGSSVRLCDVFRDDDIEKTAKVTLRDDFENIQQKYEGELQERFALLRYAKAIFDWSVLAELMDGTQSISEVKVRIYEQHEKELDNLKKIVRKYGTKYDYKVLFSSRLTEELCGKNAPPNYAAYVNELAYQTKKGTAYVTCTQEEFCGTLKAILSKYAGRIEQADLPVYQGMMEDVEEKRFLPKQKTKDNAVIPYQLYLHELRRILENAEKHHRFLTQRDEEGFSVSEKILELFKFRIPYYVGPLARTQQDSSFAWLKRTEHGENKHIYPWNFNQMIDLEGSRDAFIRRMTCKCSVLFGEDVLPKSSLLYEKYMLLNELNPLKINDVPISVELKQEIIINLFEKQQKRITKKSIFDYLLKENYIERGDVLSGVDEDIKTRYQAHHDFKPFLSDGRLTEADAEQIIYYLTLFGKESITLLQWMEENYPQLSPQEMRSILALRYQDWGRISKKLLKEIYTPDEVGEARCVIDVMQCTNANLMQIITTDAFGIQEKIRDLNEAYFAEHPLKLDEKLDSLYLSGTVKRQVQRVLAMVQEITKIMHHPPKKIFLEMARGGGEKGKRTKSRKAALLERYKLGKVTGEILQSLESQEESRLQSDRLYLYYAQLGKCMYTGEKIELADILNPKSGNKWDIDHIFPQSKVKDDSMDNRVLVKREANGRKTDTYPIDVEIRKNMSQYWRMLHGCGSKHERLVSDEKLKRLMRTTSFSEEELSGFINRQLVETRQSAKAVKQLLEEHYPETEIVCVKAGLVSEFRNAFGEILHHAKHGDKRENCNYYEDADALVKCREINDNHHAKDAYLNIVVGNVYDTMFTKNPRNFLREAKDKYSINVKSIFKRDVARGACTAWIATGDVEQKTALTVQRMMRKSNVNFTRYQTESKGKLSDENIVRAGKGQLAIKEQEHCVIKLYGGYNKLSASYFLLVKHEDKKGKKCISLVPVDLVYAKKFKQEQEDTLRYLKEVHEPKLINPQVLLNGRKIKAGTMLCFDGAYAYLRSKTGNQFVLSNAMQLAVAPEWERYAKSLLSYISKENAQERSTEDVQRFFGITQERNRQFYDLLNEKLTNSVYATFFSSTKTMLTEGREQFLALSLFEQCATLKEVVSIFKAGRAGGCDMTRIGGSKSSFIIQHNLGLSNNTFHVKSIALADRSVTGLFETLSPNLLGL